jgi:gamma-glutamyltranspeptidase/glutathione hydrolase
MTGHESKSGHTSKPEHGAIACGHPGTAAAAQEILADGGNAFDAVLAGLCAATVAEPVFCSLGGGGYLLACPAGGPPRVYDFFVETPRRRRPPADINFSPVLADFGTATQEFHIGLGAIATPGAIAGLFAAHADLGSVPMARLIEPAVRLARKGVHLRPIDSYIFGIVGRILTARPEGRALFALAGPGAASGRLLTTGETLRQPDLAATFEALAKEGPALFYGGELGRRLVADCQSQGGQITAEDLAGYQVVQRAPLERRYRHARMLTNPPPSSGGILIAFALALLEGIDLSRAGYSSADHGQALARAMILTNRARVESRLHEAMAEAEEQAAAERLLDPDLLARYARDILGRPHNPRGTTHISAVDAAGNIAALTISNGEGCGYILPDSGIMLNNMLGEEDLSPLGFHVWPEGSRMSSMMAPTVAYLDDGRIAALGSGGSNRIRTAILQVLVNLIDFALPVDRAVAAPRLHIENAIANLEDGLSQESAQAAAGLAKQTIQWPAHNLFFGGVHTVTRDADGRCAGAGDPRRGGTAVIL